MEKMLTDYAKILIRATHRGQLVKYYVAFIKLIEQSG